MTATTFTLLFQVELTDFMALLPSEPLPYPFNTLYMFTLVCDECYVKVKDGPQGFRSRPNLSHACARDTLLVKYRQHPSKPWMKIRRRQNVPTPPSHPLLFLSNCLVTCSYCCYYSSTLLDSTSCVRPFRRDRVATWASRDAPSLTTVKKSSSGNSTGMATSTSTCS